MWKCKSYFLPFLLNRYMRWNKINIVFHSEMLSVTEKKAFYTIRGIRIDAMYFLLKLAVGQLKCCRVTWWEAFISVCGAFYFQHYGTETEGAVIWWDSSNTTLTQPWHCPSELRYIGLMARRRNGTLFVSAADSSVEYIQQGDSVSTLSFPFFVIIFISKLHICQNRCKFFVFF